MTTPHHPLDLRGLGFTADAPAAAPSPLAGALARLYPGTQIENPVMFVAWFGCWLAIVLANTPDLMGPTTLGRGFHLAVAALLAGTLLFVNAIEAAAPPRRPDPALARSLAVLTGLAVLVAIAGGVAGWAAGRAPELGASLLALVALVPTVGGAAWAVVGRAAFERGTLVALAVGADVGRIVALAPALAGGEGSALRALDVVHLAPGPGALLAALAFNAAFIPLMYRLARRSPAAAVAAAPAAAAAIAGLAAAIAGTKAIDFLLCRLA